MTKEKARKKRIGNLTTVSDVIRETKRVYREARNDELSSESEAVVVDTGCPRVWVNAR